MRYSATAPVKIIVLGAGGTGGYLIPHLYRIAFSDENRDYRIIICDGDIAERKNLIRQNFIEQDIGRNKASVLAERYAGAFGIECEYIPEYIESEQRLKELVRPDFTKSPWSNAKETQRVILIGCVDNNKSRAICHKVFYETKVCQLVCRHHHMKVPVTLAPGRQRSSRSRLRLWAGGSFTLSSSFFSGPLGSGEGGRLFKMPSSILSFCSSESSAVCR